jgi:hypothetical protein
MSRLAPEIPASDFGVPRQGPPRYEEAVYDRGRGRYLKEYPPPRRSNAGFLIAGLAVIGVGALAWYYLGPDVRRYMKIRNM